MTERNLDVLLLRMVPFAESVKYAEQNLYARAAALVGDRNPREHEFSVQLRAFDAPKSGHSLGVPTLMALCSALIGKSLQGGLVVVGVLNLGGALSIRCTTPSTW